MTASCRFWVGCVLLLGARPAWSQTNGEAYPPPADIGFRQATIVSEGSRLAAELFALKENEGKSLPTIIMCHGWGGVAARLRLDAEAFARAGYFVVTFDYRGWGPSEGRIVVTKPLMREKPGEPTNAEVKEIREVVDPLDQTTDLLNVIHWVHGEKQCDTKRIGLWGTSYSGGHVVYAAARDSRVKATVSQVPGMDSRFVLLGEARRQTMEEATKRTRGEIGYPQPGAVTVGNLRGAPIRERLMNYAPVEEADKAPHCAMLFIIAEKEELFDNRAHGIKAHERARGPKKLVTIPNITHYGIYNEGRLQSQKLAIEWFDMHLKGSQPSDAALQPTTQRAASAVQWQQWEERLTAQRENPQPYAAVELNVRFTGPDDATLEVPAFWNGGQEFCFRAAFPAPGIWRWRTKCSDPADAGLHDQIGQVSVSAYAGDNPLYRHGDLRVSADNRYLVHADGKPFLWMGDTGWNAAWKSTVPEWREYVDVRARQRFSVLQIMATGDVSKNSKANPASGHAPFLIDGTPNAPFWRNLEEKLAYANDRGLVVVLTGVGKSPAGFAEQQSTPAFARYLAGRLAGHMVVLSPSMDQRIEPQNEESGTRLRKLTTHLVTQHPGTHFDTAKKYHDAAYADFCGLQTGHHGGDLNRAYDAACAWTLELWQRPPVKPVINIEAMYDAHGHDNAPNWREQDVRRLGWITWLCGSRGYTYGAGDVPPKVPGAAGGVWRFNTEPDAYDHWRKALAWPSADQMTYLRDFFAEIEWWRLEPAPELVKNQADGATRKMVASRSGNGDLLVAYLPDNAEIVLDLSMARDGLVGRWFNPVSGRSVDLATSVPPQSAATFRRPVNWSDAVLLLTKPKP